MKIHLIFIIECKFIFILYKFLTMVTFSSYNNSINLIYSMLSMLLYSYRYDFNIADTQKPIAYLFMIFLYPSGSWFLISMFVDVIVTYIYCCSFITCYFIDVSLYYFLLTLLICIVIFAYAL